MKQKRVSAGLAFFAVIIAFIVVVLGAYTRATDAGLGCPDWPGCYNRMIAPDNFSSIAKAEKAYPSMPVRVSKAWTEMIHRYAVGILSITILILAFLSFRRRSAEGQPFLLPIFLILMLIFQVLLGMWTVTLRLAPDIVMGHLLGGMIILSLLWLMFLKLREVRHFRPIDISRVKPYAMIGLVLVFLQIALGGWTSSNYAALICPQFPYCSANMFFPQSNFIGAFNFIHGLQPVGTAGEAALITIQMMHRIGALIVACYLGALSLYLILWGKSPVLKRIGVFILAFLLIQITLGIINVIWLLPIVSVILHNAVAALLLMTLLTLNYVAFRKPANYFS